MRFAQASLAGFLVCFIIVVVIGIGFKNCKLIFRLRAKRLQTDKRTLVNSGVSVAYNRCVLLATSVVFYSLIRPTGEELKSAMVT